MRSEMGFYIILAIILVFYWLLLDWLPIDVALKPNLRANIIGVFFTVLVVGRLLRIWYPPPAKTMSKFLIPQLNYCLFHYVRDLGFLLDYQFDNKGFKGMSPIDLSTYGVFLKNNLQAIKCHLENRRDTTYTREKLKDMNRMFQAFRDEVDQFVTRYGNHFDEEVLNLLYEIRHVCDYQTFFTAIPLEPLGINLTDEIHMDENISNGPMKNILILIEKIIEKIEGGIALKTEPLPV